MKGSSSTKQVQIKHTGKATSLSSVLSIFKLFRHSPEDVTLRKNLVGILGFKIKNLKHYKVALIHKSASITDSNERVINNERLEYLGDAILDAVIADYLFHMYPLESEGFLTQVRSRIVNGEKLSEIAVNIGLNHLVVSNTNRPQTKKNLFGDALEALIGAIYLDKGYHFTARYIINKILRKYIDISSLIANDTNYKSQLIEWAQREKKEVSFSTENSEESNKLFVAYIIIDNERLGRGEGPSKKVAEQEAARETLLQLGAI